MRFDNDAAVGIEDFPGRHLDAEIGGVDASVRMVRGTTGCATMPAPRPDSSLSTRSKMSTAKPRARNCRPANRPLIEPPITTARFPRSVGAAPGMPYIVPTSVGGMPWL